MLVNARAADKEASPSHFLIDSIGLPRYWAFLWTCLLPADCANSTLKGKLRRIERFYTHADSVLGYGRFDDALAALDWKTLAGVLEGYFHHLRNSRPYTPASERAWQMALPVAALLAYQATANLSPAEQLAATLVGGLIALAAHGGKTAVRAAVTPSPEPVSNISLSLGEDTLAVTLTWLATRHPYVAASIAAVMVVTAVLLIRWLWRALASLFRSAERRASPLSP